jgi:hypothetical protein
MTTEPITPFFTLMAEETSPLVMFCIPFVDAAMNDKKKFPNLAPLEGELLQAFHRLKDRLFAMTNEKEEFVAAEVPIDLHESAALMYSVANTFYALKGHIILPKEQRNPISDEAQAEIETIFYELKEQAGNLMERLTIALGYVDLGLQTMEEVFDRKIASRELKVDDKRRTATITFNDTNTKLLGFIFHFFDLLEHDQAVYDFAYRFFNSQFIHMKDYLELKAKLLPALKRKKIDLTLRDTISLYYTLNLFGRVFVSDAAKCFEDVGKNVDANAAKNPNNPVDILTPQGVKNLQTIGVQAEAGKPFSATSTDSRSLLLTLNDQFIADMRKLMKKRDEDNKIFEEYMERVNQWDTKDTKANNA